MAKATTLISMILTGSLMSVGQSTPELRIFFKEQIGLSDDQIASIARGKVVAKVLTSGSPAEIIVFGAVFVKAAPDQYVKLAFDMSRLRRSPSYLGVGRFGDPPVLSDLEGFTLEADDIRNLKTCRPGQCGVQLPAEAMQEIQATLDWSVTDVADQVNSQEDGVGSPAAISGRRQQRARKLSRHRPSI